MLYPIARRQNEALAIGYVAARIMESVFIAARDHLRARGRQLAAGLSERARPAFSLAALKDWTFLFGPGLVVPFGNGLILGYLMYRSGLVPRRMAWFGLIGGPLLLIANVGVALRLVGRRPARCSLLVDPGVHLGGVPRHLLRDLGIPEGLTDRPPELAR